VLSFYYRVTPSQEHRSRVDAPARLVLAQQQRDTQAFLHAEIGGAIKADPFFGSDLGAIGLFNVTNGKLNWMGYRPVGPGELSILHLIPASEPWPEFEHGFVNNVDHWYQPGDGRLPLKPVKDVLERAVARGTFDETVYPPLLFEKVVALVLKSTVTTGRLTPPRVSEYPAESVLPLSITRVMDIINREKWHWIVSNEVTQAAIEKRGRWFHVANNEAGQAATRESGNRDEDARFVAVSLDREDAARIAEEVERRKSQPAPVDTAPSKNGAALERAAKELQQLGIDKITEVPGLGPFTGVEPFAIGQGDRPEYEKWLLELERYVINAYVAVTRHCFGPLADRFGYVRDMPIGTLAAFNWRGPTPTIYLVRFRLPVGSSVVVERCAVEELAGYFDTKTITYDGMAYPLLEYSEIGMVPTGDPPLQGASVIRGTCPLRSRVYHLIQREFTRAWREMEERHRRL
jgi:hypothetical protein